MKNTIINLIGLIVFASLQSWWYESNLNIHTLKYAIVGLPVGLLTLFFLSAAFYTFFDWVAQILNRLSATAETKEALLPTADTTYPRHTMKSCRRSGKKPGARVKLPALSHAKF